jgi:hypothetical protein
MKGKRTKRTTKDADRKKTKKKIPVTNFEDIIKICLALQIEGKVSYANYFN